MRCLEPTDLLGIRGWTARTEAGWIYSILPVPLVNLPVIHGGHDHWCHEWARERIELIVAGKVRAVDIPTRESSTMFNEAREPTGQFLPR